MDKFLEFFRWYNYIKLEMPTYDDFNDQVIPFFGKTECAWNHFIKKGYYDINSYEAVHKIVDFIKGKTDDWK